jgi:hypothetical protein
MSIKWIGIYSGFFLLMLLVALFATGVFQQRILPRLHAEQGSEATKSDEGQEPSKDTAAGKTATAAEAKGAEPSRPPEPPPTAAPVAVTPEQTGPPKAAKDGAAEKPGQVKRLARLYEGMRPKEAATVLEKLDRSLAAGVLSEIKDRQAAKILGAMSPAVAAELTRFLGQTAAGETQ